MKKHFIIITSLLFIWFTLNITGLAIGSTILVEKAWNSSDGIFWLIFLAGIILFIIKEKAGLFYLSSFYGLWFVMQYIFTGHYIIFPNYNRIENYNKVFANTHRVISASASTLVPDTYHIVLFALIISACALSLAYLVNLRLKPYRINIQNMLD